MVPTNFYSQFQCGISEFFQAQGQWPVVEKVLYLAKLMVIKIFIEFDKEGFKFFGY